MCKSHYFFKPRVIEETYQQGLHGYRILIIGSSLPCDADYYKCTIKDICKKDTSLCDRICPPYTQFEDKDYYCLSNSNEIEIQSYIENSCKSHFFDRICGQLIGDCESEEKKLYFWNHVAFTNYHQNIYVISTDAVEYSDKDLNAFIDVLEEIKPEIIFIHKDVKDIIKDSHIVGLEEIGCFFAKSTIERVHFYPFLYKIVSKERPEVIVRDFKKNFSNVEFLEEVMLHVLFKARRHDNEFNDGVECDYTISDEMISFIEKHAWDKNLYQYLVCQAEKKSGLSEAVEYIKKNIITDEMKIASTFGINDDNCFPISGFSHSELSFFSLKKHKALQELNDFDLLLFYFDADTAKKEIKKVLAKVGSKNTNVGIVIKLSSFSYEDELLNSNRIEEIHDINGEFIYIVLANIEPKNIVSLVSGNEFCEVNVNILMNNTYGNKLSVKSYMEKDSHCQELIEKYGKQLTLLREKGWIDLDKNGKYKTNKRKLQITTNVLKEKTDISRSNNIEIGSTKGAIYLWFRHEGMKDGDIKLIFEEERRITDCVNDYRQACKKKDIVKGNSYDEIDKTIRDYFQETLK